MPQIAQDFLNLIKAGKNGVSLFNGIETNFHTVMKQIDESLRSIKTEMELPRGYYWKQYNYKNGFGNSLCNWFIFETKESEHPLSFSGHISLETKEKVVNDLTSSLFEELKSIINVRAARLSPTSISLEEISKGYRTGADMNWSGY